MTQQALAEGHEARDERTGLRVMNVEPFRSWRKVLTDLFCDAALVIVWLATLWMVVMDVLVV